MSTSQKNSTTVTQENIKSDTIGVSTVEVPAPLPSYAFSWSGYLKGLGSLFLVLFIFCIVLVIIRKKGIILKNPFSTFSFGKKGALTKKQPMAVEQRYQIDQRKSLLVVQFLNNKMLLGVTDSGITVLSEERDEGTTAHEQNVEDFNVLMGNLQEESKNTKNS